MFFLISIFLYCWAFPLHGDEVDFSGICVDLREPLYSNGVLTTEKGGVIQGKDLRLQARLITYTQRKNESEVVWKVKAEEDIIIEFGGYIFVAEQLEYNFQTKEGILYKARTSVEPWFFGGDKIYLHSDGSITLYNGFVTTSENIDSEWKVAAAYVTLEDRQYLTAKDVQFRFYEVPLLWIPSLYTNLNSIFDSPVRYNLKWGSRQGVRASIMYEIISWNRFKAFARLDYRFKRGFGGGIETYYKSEDHKEIFQTINYIADDSSISNPHERFRYRFQGLYHNLVYDDKVSIDASWDKLSDQDMPTDYNDRGLELDTAGRTQLLLRRQEENRIDTLTTCIKVNNFQTLKQELPAFEVSWRPYNVGSSRFIANSLCRAAYLDFSYSNDVINVHDFNSTRLEMIQNVYYPLQFTYGTLVPEAGIVGIFYGNSYGGKERFLTIGNLKCEARSSLCRYYNTFKHIIEPYATYQFLTFPTVSPNKHYIFDIDDGLYRVSMLKFGFNQQYYMQNEFGYLSRPFFIDLYARAFFDTPTIGYLIPKAYATVSYLTTPFMRHTLESAWDFQHRELDHFNYCIEWTVDETLALRWEYRHRSPFCWRKADPTNFILDSFRTEEELLHSFVSDRRDTFLTHLYYQFAPNWALEFELRHGWNRRTEPSYTEFEVDLVGKLQAASTLKISYQHKEDDDRIAFYFSIGISRPNTKSDACLRIPFLEM